MTLLCLTFSSLPACSFSLTNRVNGTNLHLMGMMIYTSVGVWAQFTWLHMLEGWGVFLPVIQDIIGRNGTCSVIRNLLAFALGHRSKEFSPWDTLPTNAVFSLKSNLRTASPLSFFRQQLQDWAWSKDKTHTPCIEKPATHTHSCAHTPMHTQ